MMANELAGSFLYGERIDGEETEKRALNIAGLMAGKGAAIQRDQNKIRDRCSV